MPVAAAVVGSAAVGLYSANKSAKAQKSAASDASQAQTEATQASIDEQRRQFDATQKLLAPYAQAGESSLLAQQNLLGLNGNEAQQQAIDAIRNGSAFNTYLQQGENSILQNASATGGLRGGNVQSALAQYSPNLLNQLVTQQYQNLGGITSLGQNSAALTGNAGMQSANNIGNALQSQGAYQAGNYMSAANATANQYSALSGLAGNLAGAYIGGKF